MLSEDSQRVFFASKSAATSFAFDLAHGSLRAAEIQVNRIWDHPAIQSDDPHAAAVFQDILIDVHFYFIALRNVFRFLDKVVSDEVFQELHPELANLHDKWFMHYNLGREAFEHFDQRLPGQKYENRIVEIEERGAKRKIHFGLSLSNGLFRHSDQEWDISKATYESINADVVELLTRIVDKGGDLRP